MFLSDDEVIKFKLEIKVDVEYVKPDATKEEVAQAIEDHLKKAELSKRISQKVSSAIEDQRAIKAPLEPFTWIDVPF
jgi:D-aminopeptidase